MRNIYVDGRGGGGRVGKRSNNVYIYSDVVNMYM